MRIILVDKLAKGYTIGSMVKYTKSTDLLRITDFKPGNMAYRHKLLAMGLTPGTTFTIRRVAPLGDPIEIEVRGYSLSLRKKEADILCIERLEREAL